MKKKLLILALIFIAFITMGAKKTTNVVSPENDPNYYPISIGLTVFIGLFFILILWVKYLLEHPSHHHEIEP